jgi:hypothetical protein
VRSIDLLQVAYGLWLLAYGSNYMP